MTPTATPSLDDGVRRKWIETLVAEGAPRWLETRRWFGDKGRSIVSAEVRDTLFDRIGDDFLAISVVNVHFLDGGSALYFLPLAGTQTTPDADPIGSAVLLGASHYLIDATETNWFGGWMLDRLAGRGQSGTDAWPSLVQPGASHVIQDARMWAGTPMGAEQSNTSLRFDRALILKLFRRMQPGPSPDEEALRVLAEVQFSCAPGFVGSAAWRSPDGVEYPIALAQAFVDNQGDGWTWMLQRLARLAAGESADEKQAVQGLGQRTAELHIALSESGNAAFAPELAGPAMIAREIERTRDATVAAVALLLEREASLPSSIQSKVREIFPALLSLAGSAEGYRVELGVPRVRVHGDYHLGQTLRTPDDDWVIIDFEGEPARSVAERRQKTSVLKDVAGMLRSFAYARGVTERNSPGAEGAQRLMCWEKEARQSFIAAYRETLRAAESKLAPTADRDFDQALAAWEFDKAVYEITYEAQNRPDWLRIPLSSLLPAIVAQAPEATGAAPA
jgi:maltose alpha-D-glucosyltransferase/alpha-amylase